MEIDISHTATSSATINLSLDTLGKVTATSDINFTEPVDYVSRSAITEPYQVSVAAKARIDGVWKYADDENDEVLIVFDNNSFSLVVDPDDVEYALNSITGAQQPQVDSLRAADIRKYTMLIAPAARSFFSKFSKLEDIKTDGTFMRLKTEKHISVRGSRDVILYNNAVAPGN